MAPHFKIPGKWPLVKFLIECRNAICSVKKIGLVLFLERLLRYFLNLPVLARYPVWILLHEPGKKELESMKDKIRGFRCQPKISLVISAEKPLAGCARQMIESLTRQIYQNFEIYLPSEDEEDQLARALETELGKTRVKRFSGCDPEGPGRSLLMNPGEGEYVGFLGRNDALAPFSLYEIVEFLNENNFPDVVYSDEDRISVNGKTRFDPVFKPDWSPDTFFSKNYIGGFLVIKRSVVQEAGGILGAPDPGREYDLLIRVLKRKASVGHIPRVLYHRRASGLHPVSMEENEKRSSGDVKKKIEALARGNGREVEVLDGLIRDTYRVRYRVDPGQKVSIIIPNRDKAEILENCISSILDRTAYKNFEIIVVDNRSVEPETLSYYEELKNTNRISVLQFDHPFNFSAINNYAARHVQSGHLLFLNNDTEVISDDWLLSMLEFSQRGDVGAVGAKLYFPDETIQHAGVIVGIRGGVGHVHRLFPKSSDGYQGRLKIVQNFNAVTGACMMVPFKVFQEVGGFDEDFAVDYSDIDLCLKMRAGGYLVVFTPFAELLHHESASRGADDTLEKYARSQNEARNFRKKWESFFAGGDPYYNPNLTLQRDDFSIRIA